MSGKLFLRIPKVDSKFLESFLVNLRCSIYILTELGNLTARPITENTLHPFWAILPKQENLIKYQHQLPKKKDHLLFLFLEHLLVTPSLSIRSFKSISDSIFFATLVSQILFLDSTAGLRDCWNLKYMLVYMEECCRPVQEDWLHLHFIHFIH